MDKNRVPSELRDAEILYLMVKTVDLGGAVESEDGREPQCDCGQDLPLLPLDVHFHAQVGDVAAHLVK